MSTAVNLAVGLITLGVLGLGAGAAVRAAKNSIPLNPLEGVPPQKWDELTGDDGAGWVLGHCERILLFLAFWAGADVVAAGWLAFKVASKWNVWTNLIAVPKELHGVDPLDYLIARRQWGGRTLAGFLVGTLYSLITAFAAVALGKNWSQLLADLLLLVR